MGDIKFIWSICCFLLISNSTTAQTDSEAGKAIFNTRCTSCHSVGKKIVGPALKDVEKRHSEKWIINFVHHSQNVIKSGDKQAISLFEENNRVMMPDHPDLTETDIRNILSYIKAESVRLASAPSGPRIRDNHKPYLGESSIIHQLIYLDLDGEHIPVKKGDFRFWLVIGIIITIIILILVLFVSLENLIYKLKKNNKDLSC